MDCRIDNGGAVGEVKTYNVGNCVALSVKTGLHIDTGDKEAIFNITNFNAHIPATTATDNGTFPASSARDVINIEADSEDFTVNIANCGGYIDNDLYSTTESYGFVGVEQPADTTTQKIINIKNCTLEFSDPAQVRTDGTSGWGKGFYHTIASPGAGVEVHISNCSELGSADDALSIGVISYEGEHQLYINDCRPEFIKSGGESGLCQD